VTWGTRVRLSGGHLAHYGGQDQDDGVTWLAHGSFAWTDTLRPAGEDAPECPRCVRRLPQLEHQRDRAVAEGIARRCGCGRFTFWPDFGCRCNPGPGE
jgi:hypothetical protein